MNTAVIRPQTTRRDLDHYFEYSSKGIEVLRDGLEELTFGEYLVSQKAISREELFRALQMQDREPGKRLGECLASMGILGVDAVMIHLRGWKGITTIEA